MKFFQILIKKVPPVKLNSEVLVDLKNIENPEMITDKQYDRVKWPFK